MKRRIHWTATARDEVVAIAEYLANTSPIYAERWTERILRRVDSLARFPESGRPVPEGNQPDLREVLEGPYRIIYLVQSRRIDILAVVHGRQELRWPAGVFETAATA